jgi:hypothetical protein
LVVVVVAAVVAVAAVVVILLTVALALAVEAPAVLGTITIVATPELLVSAVPVDGVNVPKLPAEKVTTTLAAAPPVCDAVATKV